MAKKVTEQRLFEVIDRVNEKIGRMKYVENGSRNNPFTKIRELSLNERIDAIEKYLGIKFTIQHHESYQLAPKKNK